MLNIKLEERITVDQIIEFTPSKFIPLEIFHTVSRITADRELELIPLIQADRELELIPLIQADLELELMFYDTKICKTNKEKIFLLNTLGGKLFEATLLYQKDMLDKEEFHRLCDNKGPTITLAQLTRNDHCVGGFTNAHWTSPDDYVSVKDS